jgi:hypothetical protein
MSEEPDEKQNKDSQDRPPAAPADDDAPAGDTDQHSDAESPPAQTN